MMSNPPSSLQSRQKLHKRQLSTPVAFEAMKVQMPPNSIQQRQALHRRGQSYDMGRTPIRRHQHTGSAVSMNTNIGSLSGQQILREAQQQRIARPGQQQIQPRIDTTSAQQCGFFGPQSPFDMSMNAFVPSPNGMVPHSQYQIMPIPMSQDSQGMCMFNGNNTNYFQAIHQLQEQQMMPQHDRRMSQPDLRIQTGLRPYTPTHQIQTAYFPLTPAQTPRQHQQQHHTRSLQGSPRWQQQDENIVSPRPVSMRKSRSLQGIAEHQEVRSFDNVLEKVELATNQAPAVKKEPTKSKRLAHAKTASFSSAQDSKPLFGEIIDDVPQLDEQPVLAPAEPPSSPSRPALSPRRMSISDLNLEPGISASITETDVTLDDIAQYIDGPDAEDNKWTCKFEGCDKKFGRKENIKSHVQTHLGDRQFKCNHCEKCFVRGHDLKRHAKIHTGSKNYTCLCGNAFARHDALTRHRQRGMCVGAFEGIVRKEIKRGRPRKHRPEMDERLDKASRSRQKRSGSNSHAQGADPYTSSASSCSFSSWGSPPTETLDNLSIHGGTAPSPDMTYDDNMNLFGLTDSQSIEIHAQQMDDHVTSNHNIFTFTPPTSPGFSTGNRPSPSCASKKALTPADMISFDETNITQVAGQPTDHLEVMPQVCSQSSVQTLDRTHDFSQAVFPLHLSLCENVSFELPAIPESHHNIVSATQATSLPSLSHSSSPPPQESGTGLVFDFPDESNAFRMSTISNMSFGLSAVPKELEPESRSEDGQRNDFDSFLDFNDDSQLGMGISMGGSDDSFFASL